MATRQATSRKLKSIFLSHSSRDNPFCTRLANDLTELGVSVWYDQWEIKVGDSLRQKIADGISGKDFLAVVLSTASVSSQWVAVELNAALARELKEKDVFVLPLLIEDCEIPVFLQDKKYADFRSEYKSGVDELLEVLEVPKTRRSIRSVDNTPVAPSRRLDELALAPADFQEWLLDILEQQNPIRVLRFLNNWRDAALNMTLEEQTQELAGRQFVPSSETARLLEKLLQVGVVFLKFGQADYFAKLCDILYEAYLVINERGRTAGASSDWNTQTAVARCDLMDVIYVLGALAMEEQTYPLLPTLIDRRPTGDEYWAKEGWFMYSTVMAARANRQRQSSWYHPIGRAQTLISSRPEIRNWFNAAKDPLTAICQFDLVQAFTWTQRLKSDKDWRRTIYADAATQASRHVEPLVTDLLDRRGPTSVIPTFTDDDLGDTLIEFMDQDSQRFFASGWSAFGFEDNRIKALLIEARKRKNAPNA
jgi:TIR domain